MAAVPVVHTLADIYPEDAVAEQTARWRRLLAAFRAAYGREAAFVARSPGRVNIIGEHIDYSLYSVLPMAITADCLVAVGWAEEGGEGGEGDVGGADASRPPATIQLANVDAARFPARTFAVPFDEEIVPIDARVHEWSNYFKAGLRGALSWLREEETKKSASAGGPGIAPRSLQVVMDGSVPPGGGLSSSAALTSASALSVLYAQAPGGAAVDKTALTELAIVSERSVGVNAGGMDQAASVMAEKGAALLVSFAPALAARPVRFPPTRPALVFLVAQSFVTADKFVSGPVHYNLRVVECTLAAAVLHAVLLGRRGGGGGAPALPPDSSPLGTSLRGFHEAYFAAQGPGQPGLAPADQLRTLLALVETALPQTAGYTRAEVAALLGVDVDALDRRYMARFPVRAERFLLQQRARHVFGEALRVLAFMQRLEGGAAATDEGAASDTTAFNESLGALLNASQASCRDLYDCSCPELDALCAIARRAGSYGSRLTGAGWGGCTVHLVPEDKVAAVRAAWDAEYYAPRGLTPAQRAAAVLVSRPGSGSAVFVGALEE